MFVVTVPSSDGKKTYTIRKAGDVWTCDCKGHVYHSHGEAYTCRHIAELASSLFEHVAKSAIGKEAKAKLKLA